MAVRCCYLLNRAVLFLYCNPLADRTCLLLQRVHDSGIVRLVVVETARNESSGAHHIDLITNSRILTFFTATNAVGACRTLGKKCFFHVELHSTLNLRSYVANSNVECC